MKSKVVRQNVVFVLAMILTTIYLFWRLFFTLPLHDGVWNVVAGVLLLVAETVTIATTFDLFLQRIRMKRFHLELPEIAAEDYPDVDVLIATHNEEIDLLYKTVSACTFMDYPDKHKVHIFVCDDGNRPEVAEMAAGLGVGYIGLENNTEAKSGNYNNALKHTGSALFATFDTDMIPRHDFLMKTVPYFLLPEYVKEGGVWRRREPDEMDGDTAIGLVQTPQSFYNPDLFQFNLYAEHIVPNEQDFFSRQVNVMRNTSNSVAYTGSNAVLSRKAMEDIGGFPLNTITEDFETSLRMQQLGYTTYASDEVVSSGLSTTTIPAMIKQRTRWARGIIQSMQNAHPFRRGKLSVTGKISYLGTFLYWWSFANRLIFILAPILFALFDFRIVVAGIEPLLLIWLPAYAFYAGAMRYLSGDMRNQRWSQVIDTILMPYLIVPVLLETLHIHQRTFHVTEKSRENTSSKRGSSLLLAVPNAALLLLTVAALVRFMWGKYGWEVFYGSIIIFWLAYNMVSLIYALFFMLGRPAYRRSERFPADEAVSISVGGEQYDLRTVDVSEEGMAVVSDISRYFNESVGLSMTIHNDRYRAKLHGKMIYARRTDQGWRYSFTVEPFSEDDRRQFMQIIYDRGHPLPLQMDMWDTVYDDLLRNVKRRLEKPKRPFGAFSEMPVPRHVVFDDGSVCTKATVGYRTWTVAGLESQATDGVRLARNLVFTTDSGVSIQLSSSGQIDGDKEVLLVSNLKELAEKGNMSGLLEEVAATVAHRAERSAAVGSTRDERTEEVFA
jgi:cellulose synthase (UDP-forming)